MAALCETARVQQGARDVGSGRTCETENQICLSRPHRHCVDCYVAGVIDAQTAIEEIRGGRACFEVRPTSFDRAVVTAREAYGGPYLFANWDGTRKNNLHQLAATASPRLHHQCRLRQRTGVRLELPRWIARIIEAANTRTKRGG
jgi:hypothetical protein